VHRNTSTSARRAGIREVRKQTFLHFERLKLLALVSKDVRDQAGANLAGEA
jgi:hypothetical protein